jgi:hypothetical protein
MERSTLNSIVSILSQKIKDLVAVYDDVRNLWIMEHGISGTLVVGHTCVHWSYLECKRTYPEEGNNEGR